MKIIIIRTIGNIVNYNHYNLQEIGLAKALFDCGIHCDIVYYNGLKKLSIQEVIYKDGIIKIYWMPGVSIAGNGIFYKLSHILDNYDIIQTNEYDQLYSLYLAFISKYKNRVVLCHGPYYSKWKTKYNLKCLFIDRIPLSKNRKLSLPCIAKSELAKQFLESRGFGNVHVTGIGLDTDRFCNIQQLDNNLKPAFDRLMDKFVLLYVGKIEKGKCILFLIKLLKKIQYKIENVELVLVGRGKYSYELKCSHLIRDYNLEDKVLWINEVEQSQLPYFYKRADIFLLPSMYEIFGMVLLEGMFYSLPVITTEHGGSSTIIENGSNGYVCPLNINIWLDIIIKLYENRKRRLLIGHLAHNSIVNGYTWETIASKIVPLYENLVSGKDMQLL